MWKILSRAKDAKMLSLKRLKDNQLRQGKCTIYLPVAREVNDISTDGKDTELFSLCRSNSNYFFDFLKIMICQNNRIINVFRFFLIQIKLRIHKNQKHHLQIDKKYFLWLKKIFENIFCIDTDLLWLIINGFLNWNSQTFELTRNGNSHPFVHIRPLCEIWICIDKNCAIWIFIGKQDIFNWQPKNCKTNIEMQNSCGKNRYSLVCENWNFSLEFWKICIFIWVLYIASSMKSKILNLYWKQNYESSLKSKNLWIYIGNQKVNYLLRALNLHFHLKAIQFAYPLVWRIRQSSLQSAMHLFRIYPHWENYTFISFHIEWEMIVVTVFLSILSQMDLHLV